MKNNLDTIPLLLKRTVLKSEFQYLKRDFVEGEVVYLYMGNTYNCVGDSGTPCTVNGDLPFFELPSDSLRAIDIRHAEYLKSKDKVKQVIREFDEMYKEMGKPTLKESIFGKDETTKKNKEEI
jgi:phytoene dehydrogenase-like protein